MKALLLMVAALLLMVTGLLLMVARCPETVIGGMLTVSGYLEMADLDPRVCDI